MGFLFTYEIFSPTDCSTRYMYGGRAGDNDTNVFFDDIHVLSLPSFTWTVIDEASSPRYGHTCHRVANRQMITVGGASNYNYTKLPCDPQTKGVNVFDMSEPGWRSVFDANAPEYEVPTQVTAVIGGTGQGGSTMKEPIGGFEQEGLAQLFGVAWTPKPTPQITKSSDKNSPSDKSFAAPIIGGIVGGVALISITATIAFVYRRRIRCLFTGESWTFEEMDGEGRAEVEGRGKMEAEMMANRVCWELAAFEGPVELSSNEVCGKNDKVVHHMGDDPPPWAPPVTDEGIPF